MSDKQPTEAQWRLITEELGWTLVEQFHPVRIPVNTCKICSSKPSVLVVFLATGEAIFDPLHNHNDLARLMKAMQGAGYHVSRWAWAHQPPEHETNIHRKGDSTIISMVRASTDLAATFWAIVEALEAKEKHDTEPDDSHRIVRGYSGKPTADDGFMS